MILVFQEIISRLVIINDLNKLNFALFIRRRTHGKKGATGLPDRKFITLIEKVKYDKNDGNNQKKANIESNFS